MRKKGYPHGELPDDEKAFLARRKASIEERRREREKRLKINLEKEEKTESAEYGHAV